jgi:hypothetical protein
MKKDVLLPLVALCGLVLVAGVGLTLISHVHDRGPVYSVEDAQLQAVEHRTGWQSQPLLVRGRLVPCLPLCWPKSTSVQGMRPDRGPRRHHCLRIALYSMRAFGYRHDA